MFANSPFPKPAWRRPKALSLLLMFCLWASAALVATGVFGAPPASAATTSCSSFSSSGIIFSPYDTVTKAAVDGVGTFTLTCTGTGTDTLNIVISGGNAGVCSPREMRNGTEIGDRRHGRHSAPLASIRNGWI